MIVCIELKDPFRLRFTFLLDDRFEQLFLVLEIDIERALGDAGRAGNVVHAGGVETLREEDRAGALNDLTAFGAVLIRDLRPLLNP